MTLIAFQDGKVVMRDGKVGTEAECCCGCPRCIRNGEWDCQYTTKETCEECVRSYDCFESLQTKCDGTCPDGFSPQGNAISLSFSSDGCAFPGGGSAAVSIGCGQILSATVTDGGDGYAKIGRVPPTVAASIQQSGVTLDFSGSTCGQGAAGTVAVVGGTIVSATVTSGGANYAELKYAEPTLSLSVPGGTGGAIAISGYFHRTTGDAAGYYGISGVTVTAGGSGYADNTKATITLGTDDEKLSSKATPDIRIRTEKRAPSDDWTLSPNGVATGSGLVVSLTLASTGPWWAATAASVVSGGTGYTVGDLHDVDAVEGPTRFQATIEITSVGPGGVVTGIAIAYEGEFGGVDTGVIKSVTVGEWQGAYRKKTVAVCSVSVNVVQAPPASGSGAEITASVDDNPNSQHFGKIVGLSVVNGGSGYASGSGGQLSVSLESRTDSCGLHWWRIGSINVIEPGDGYREGDLVVISASVGDTVVQNAVATLSVDEDGGITAVAVEAAGYYYREDATQPSHTFPVAVTVDNGPSGLGSGAAFTAVVDDDPASATFGQVTGVTVTNGGSGYVSLCDRTRSVDACSECPPRQQPEQSICSVASEDGVCGNWQGGFPCDDAPPCCDSCLAPAGTCVPTLNVSENTPQYIKASTISGPPPGFVEPIPWNEQWLAEHEACLPSFVWVQDYVSQTDATGKYCGFALQYRAWGANDNPPPNYQPPQGCEVQGWGYIYCHVYSKQFWFRQRLFLVDCRDRTVRDVTEEAFTAPIEWGGCAVPGERFDCDPGIGGASLGCLRPACDVANACEGENPGFLSPVPTLECQ